MKTITGYLSRLRPRLGGIHQSPQPPEGADEAVRSIPQHADIWREARLLQIYTRRLANQGLLGQYRSAYRGQGMEFEEVRQYLPGDDVRSLDWKVTARSRSPFVRVYREERELSVMLAIDLSASTAAATARGADGAVAAALSSGHSRREVISRFSALLALIALQNNDRVGCLTFSDRVHTYMPPRRGRGAVRQILHTVLSHPPVGPQHHVREGTTALGPACDLLDRVLRRGAVVFVLSDFIADGYQDSLARLARFHDVTAVVTIDPGDLNLPDVGLVTVRDPETGAIASLDSSATAVRQMYAERAAQRRRDRVELFVRRGIGMLELSTADPFLSAVGEYFQLRKSRRVAHYTHEPLRSGRGGEFPGAFLR